MSVLQNFLRQRPARGERVPYKLGSQCGHCFQKQWHRVQNCYAAGGRQREEDCANESEFSKMHIAVPVQWQLRSQRRQLAHMFQNDMHTTVSCKLQVYIEIGQCETLVVVINNVCNV